MNAGRRAYFRLAMLAGFLVLLGSCRGLDDDILYAARTQFSFFVVPESGGNAIHAVADSQLVLDFQQQIGLNRSNVDAFGLGNGYVWISDADAGNLHQIDPSVPAIVESWNFSGFAPHFFSVGEKYVLLSDSAQHKVAYLRLRKGKIYQSEWPAQPRQALYNGGKFYLLQDCCTLGIVSESALTQYVSFDLGRPVSHLLFDRNRNLIALTADSSGFYLNQIDANGDLLFLQDVTVGYPYIEHSPWFNQLYGSEFIGNIRVKNSGIEASEETNGGKVAFTVADSADFFSTDFFEGNIFYTHADSLFGFSLGKREKYLSFLFPYSPAAGFHHLGTAGGL